MDQGEPGLRLDLLILGHFSYISDPGILADLGLKTDNFLGVRWLFSCGRRSVTGDLLTAFTDFHVE